MRTRPTNAWIEGLEAKGVPCGPINDYAQVFENPQVRHRGMRVDLPRGDGGTAATIASPLRLKGTPPDYRRAPPLLGEHTMQVLCDVLGKSDEEIERLGEIGALGRRAARAENAANVAAEA